MINKFEVEELIWDISKLKKLWKLESVTQFAAFGVSVEEQDRGHSESLSHWIILQAGPYLDVTRLVLATC